MAYQPSYPPYPLPSNGSTTAMSRLIDELWIGEWVCSENVELLAVAFHYAPCPIELRVRRKQV